MTSPVQVDPDAVRRANLREFLIARRARITPEEVGLAPGGRSSLTVVGGEGLPNGFGKGFSWDRAEDEALLVMFVNAADPLGVSIDGLQAGDQVQVLSASGIASFSEDTGNPLASSIVVTCLGW